MIETEAQRRWWFATHPELSGGRKGERTGNRQGKGESDKVSPEVVDEYVERALEHETDEVVIELLKSTKFWFGTEFDSKPPEEQHALLWGDEDSEESEHKQANRGDHHRTSQETGGHPAASRTSYDQYEDVRDRVADEQWIDDWIRKGREEAIEPDPITAFDFLTSELKLLTAPLAFLKSWARSAAKRTVVHAVKKDRPPARLPPKGTKERARIEAARKRGRDRKEAEERANIQAGGKGSGVWTEEELQEIRRTGEFPNDAEWHHDPTVANRPDLADNPRVVHPVRGGRKGHLDEHGGDWRNPRE